MSEKEQEKKQEKEQDRCCCGCLFSAEKEAKSAKSENHESR